MASKDLEVVLRIRALVEGLKDLGLLSDGVDDVGKSSSEAAQTAQALGGALSQLEKEQKLINNFRDLQSEISKTDKSLDNAKKRTAELGKEMSAAEKPSKSLGASFNRSRAETKKLAAQYQDQRIKLQGVRKEMSGVGISTKNLAAHQATLRKELKASEKNLTELKTKLTQTRKESNKKLGDPTGKLNKGLKDSANLTNNLGSSLKSTARQVIAFGAAFLGLNKVNQGLKSILNTGGQFEALNQQLKAVMGSVEAGEQAFSWIKDFTKETPFQLDQVAQAFVKLKAFGLDPMDGSMQAIVDQSAKLGGSQETLNGIILAVGQAWAKQKLQGEEILQLVERGVPVWDLLSEATGRNTVELQKMSAAGKLGRKEIGLLIKAIGDSSQGAAADTMSTWNGLVSNLKDQWNEFIDLIARSGTLDYFKQQIVDVGVAARKMAEDGSLKRWAENISQAITGTANVIKQSISIVSEYSGALLLMAKAFAAVKIAGLASQIVRFGASLAGSIVSLTSFSSAANNTTGKVKGLGAALKRIPGNIIISLAVLGFEAAVKTGKVLGETIAKLTLDQDALRRAQERYNKSAYEGIAAGRDLAEKNSQYKDTVIQTAAAIADMADDEVAAYRKRLEGLREYERGQLRVALNEELLGQNTKARQQEIAQSFTKMREAFVAIDEAAALAAEALGNELSVPVQKLVEQFSDLISKGGEVKESLADIFNGFDPQSIESVRNFGGMLQYLAEQGTLTAEVIRDQLIKSLSDLSGQDLLKFQVTAEAAFGGAKDAASELTVLLDGSLSAALKRIGVDVHEVETGITTAGQDIIDTFQAIASNAQASGTQIAAAFNAALGKLGNKKELAALKVELQAAFDAGKISAAEALPLFSAVEEKLREVKGAAKDTKEEFAGLAETSSQAATEAESAAASWSSFWTGLRDSFYEMSDEIGQAYDIILDRNARLNHTTFGFFDNLNDGLEGLTRTYQQQETSFNALMRKIEDGTLSADRLESAGNNAANSFGLLGRERLSELRGALDDALRKIERLDESSQRTLEGLQDRLDRLQGNEQDIQQREYERQRKELEKQLEEAQQLGATDAAADLRDALQLLQQVNRVEIQRIQERQAERDQPSPAETGGRKIERFEFNANGVTEPEALARLIEPMMRKIMARSS